MIPRNVLIAGTTLLALCGCGTGSGDSSAPGAQPAGSSAPVTAAGPTNESSLCGGTADKVKQHVSRPEIRTVAMVGQCTTVSITTTLADGDSGVAKQLCDSAAEVAYSADTNSIRVLGASKKELAVGIAKAKCLAEP